MVTDTQISTLAGFKRAMRTGLVFRCEHFRRPEIGGLREVEKVQRNGFYFWFDHPERGRMRGWLEYPKASELRFEGSSVVFLDGTDGPPAFTYHLGDLS